MTTKITRSYSLVCDQCYTLKISDKQPLCSIRFRLDPIRNELPTRRYDLIDITVERHGQVRPDKTRHMINLRSLVNNLSFNGFFQLFLPRVGRVITHNSLIYYTFLGGRSNAVASCSKCPLCEPSQNGLFFESPQRQIESTVLPCNP